MNIPETAKAYIAAIVGVAAYIVGNGGFTNTTLWWAGLVIFVAAGYGITWAVPNKPIE